MKRNLTPVTMICKKEREINYRSELRTIGSAELYFSSIELFRCIRSHKLKKTNQETCFNHAEILRTLAGYGGRGLRAGFSLQFSIHETPVELNSLLSKFFCYITWFVISPDQTRLWTTCKQGLYVKSYCFKETIG